MRILIADGAPKVRSALRLYIEQTQPSCQRNAVASPTPMDVLVEAESVAAVAACIDAGRIDLALVDWRLPTSGGEAAVRLVRERWPCARVIALSGRPEVEDEALAAGADAFVCKGAPPEALGAVLSRLTATDQDCAGADENAVVCSHAGCRMDFRPWLGMPRLPRSGLVTSVL